MFGYTVKTIMNKDNLFVKIFPLKVMCVCVHVCMCVCESYCKAQKIVPLTKGTKILT